jgi:seryl-tRNA synthetase
VTARVLLAIMENNQDSEGKWGVPAVLKEFGAP